LAYLVRVGLREVEEDKGFSFSPTRWSLFKRVLILVIYNILNFHRQTEQKICNTFLKIGPFCFIPAKYLVEFQMFFKHATLSTSLYFYIIVITTIKAQPSWTVSHLSTTQDDISLNIYELNIIQIRI